MSISPKSPREPGTSHTSIQREHVAHLMLLLLHYFVYIFFALPTYLSIHPKPTCPEGATPRITGRIATDRLLPRRTSSLQLVRTTTVATDSVRFSPFRDFDGIQFGLSITTVHFSATECSYTNSVRELFPTQKWPRSLRTTVETITEEWRDCSVNSKGALV